MHQMLHSQLQVRPEDIHTDQFHFHLQSQGQAALDRLSLKMKELQSFERPITIYQSRLTFPKTRIFSNTVVTTSNLPRQSPNLRSYPGIWLESSTSK